MNTSAEIKIAYADDHALVRKGITDYIRSFGPAYKVTIQAANGLELLEQLTQASELPDLCILDIFMPVMNGLEALVKIRERWPRMKALVLTAHNTDYYMLQFLRAGANGFLQKSCEPEELKNAVTAIYEHGVYSSDAAVYKYHKSEDNHEHIVPEFTDMEIAVLKLCCSDLSYTQIAQKLNTTMHSVDWYRSSLFKKLQVASRSGLVMFAIQFGLVELDIDPTAKSMMLKKVQ
jgi:DNA-binding NarL/FixJ family response regulator